MTFENACEVVLLVEDNEELFELEEPREQDGVQHLV